MKRVQTCAIAYGSTSFAAAAIQALFVTYHITLFLDVYEVTPFYFYLGESIVMVWTCINDPIFGYFMSGKHGYKRHLNNIAMGGCLLAMGFLFIFFPMWRLDSDFATGLHFIVSLLLFDGLFSFVMIAHSSLLADLTTATHEREICNLYGATMGACGSLSVFVGNFWWNPADLFEFRIFCFGVAIVCAMCFYLTAELCERGIGLSKKQDDNSFVVNYGNDDMPRLSIRKFVKQIATHKNLMLFLFINLIQVFNCHFNSNFLPFWVNYFIADYSSTVGSIVLGASASLPHAFVVFLSPLVRKRGAALVVQAVVQWRAFLCILSLICLPALASGWLQTTRLLSFFVEEKHFWSNFSLGLLVLVCANTLLKRWHVARLLVSMAALLMWTQWNVFLVIAMFLILNKLMCEAVCRHGNLILSDLIDEDAVRNGRVGSESTMLYGVVTFFSQPGMSFAPMIGYSLLQRIDVPLEKKFVFDNNNSEYDYHTTRLLIMMCGVPLLCAFSQVLLWRGYTLIGPQLQEIRTRLKYRPLVT